MTNHNSPLRRTTTDPKIERLLKVMEEFRHLDREMPASVVSCFLYVASHDNCHKQALEEDLSMKSSSSSRNTDWLSKYHRLKKPGLNLIIKEPDQENRRRQVLSLSEKGRKLVKLVQDHLSSEVESSTKDNTTAPIRQAAEQVREEGGELQTPSKAILDWLDETATESEYGDFLKTEYYGPVVITKNEDLVYEFVQNLNDNEKNEIKATTKRLSSQVRALKCVIEMFDASYETNSMAEKREAEEKRRRRHRT